MNNRSKVWHCTLWVSALFVQSFWTLPTYGAQTVAATGAQSPSQEELLNPASHVSNPRSVLIYDAQPVAPPEYRNAATLFRRQLAVISQAKTEKRLDLLPNLVAYLDYPRLDAVPSRVPKDPMLEELQRRNWPAFDAILSFGFDAVEPLRRFILSSEEPINLRLAALQVMWAIAPEQSQDCGEELERQFSEPNHVNLVALIRSIRTGQLRFWGGVEYRPLTMNAAEVTDLLREDRHLDNALGVLARGRASQRNHENPPADYELYLRQKKAMQDAGELKLASVIPSLLRYVDYPSGIFSLIYSSADNLPEGRRQKWPAIDAILTIGSAAYPPLREVVTDQKNAMKVRVDALDILLQMDLEQALPLGNALLGELQQANNADELARVKALVNGRGRNPAAIH